MKNGNPIPQPRPVLHVPTIASAVIWWGIGGILFLVLCILSAALS